MPYTLIITFNLKLFLYHDKHFNCLPICFLGILRSSQNMWSQEIYNNHTSTCMLTYTLSFLPAVQSQVLIVRSPRLGHAVSCPSSTIEDVCCTLYKHQIWLPRMLFHDKYVSTNEEHIYKTFHIALLKNGELTPQNSKLLPHNSNR